MGLFRQFRQVEEETPCRDHIDGPGFYLDPIGLVPGNDRSGFQTQRGHRLAQSHCFPFSCLGFGQGLAHLDQHPRPTTHRDDEIDLPAGLGLEIVERLEDGRWWMLYYGRRAYLNPFMRAPTNLGYVKRISTHWLRNKFPLRNRSVP